MSGMRGSFSILASIESSAGPSCCSQYHSSSRLLSAPLSSAHGGAKLPISQLNSDSLLNIAAAADAPVLSSDSSDEEVGGVAAGARWWHQRKLLTITSNQD